MDPEIEAKFTNQQKSLRREMFYYLIEKGKKNQGEWEMNEIILNSIPKVQTGVNELYP